MAYKDFYHLMLEYFAQPAELVTGVRNQPFTLYAEDQKLFVRNGKNNVSRLDPKEVAAFVVRLEETESLSPKDYQKVTFKASYLLAAMKYIAEQNSPGTSTPGTSIVRFHNEDQNDSEERYKDWLSANPEGYVLSLHKRSEKSDHFDPTASTCLHCASCSSVNNTLSYSQPKPFTGGDYFKICSTSLAALEEEAIRITTLSFVKRHSCIKIKTP